MQTRRQRLPLRLIYVFWFCLSCRLLCGVRCRPVHFPLTYVCVCVPVTRTVEEEDPAPALAPATPASDVDNFNNTTTDGDTTDGDAPPRGSSIVPRDLSAEEVTARVRTIMLSLTFVFHLLNGLAAGPVMLFAPGTAAKLMYGGTVSPITLSYIQYTGAAVCIMGILGPVAGLLAKSRAALAMLVWMELLWNAMCTLIAAKAYTAEGRVPHCLFSAAVGPLPALGVGESRTCYDADLTVVVTALILLFAYGYHVSYDDFSWAKNRA